MRIDSHVHLITARMIREATARYNRMKPGLLERVVHDGRKLINPEFIEFLDRMDVPAFARLWEAELEKHRIDHACFLPISGTSLAEIEEFVSLNPSRFSGYVYLENPASKRGVATFKRLIKSGAFVGLKLYPCIQRVSVADKALFPLYEAAAELSAPVLIHFGITHAPVTDYRYTNPLDLQLPAKLFPDTNFIIAHFGAGFFREVLLLGFHAENIYVDTSGTNNWRLFLPEVMSLKKIFRRTIDVYGAGRVLYGTDSAIGAAAGYRGFVLKEQTRALAQLKIPAKDKKQVMGGNAARLFRLEKRLST